MNRVVVTGLGFITSIGNSKADVLQSLREARSGVDLFEPLVESNSPVKLAGTIKGFDFPSDDPIDWILPESIALKRAELRTMTPNALFAYAAMLEAIRDAGLAPSQVSSPDTGLYCASAGSAWLTHTGLVDILTRGPGRVAPPVIIAGMPNSLHLNLVARFKIKGASVGFSSACSSSAHALGHAFDLIKSGRQNFMFVVGAEDCHPHNILPFAGLRALSVQTDPSVAPCAFDVSRDGFVVTGGGVVLVLENAVEAERRGAEIYSEIVGWGQASDGYDVVAPDPSGAGLAAAMHNALKESNLHPDQVDYVNAHATSTATGDLAEGNAIRSVFGPSRYPYISSTKSITGHGLSLAGAMEAAFCCLSIREKFMPVSANIRVLDPAFADLPILVKPIDTPPRVVLSNSSGFGGANVSLAFASV
ncbi:MAG TPA: beta-ketoacyl-[acyl-carrier-protein] synthase family protein [Chthoniobacterales bacterium]